MLEREARKLRALQEELARSRSLEMLRTKGEMVLAYMHTVEPGQTLLKVEGADFTIALDPSLTPVENAQAFFREYRKAQSAQEGLPEKVAEAQAGVDFWDGLITSLELAASYDDIRAVQEEMRAARKGPAPQEQPKQQKGKSKGRKSAQEKLPQPLRLRTSHGAHLLVGRTAGQNDTATFRLAAPDDLWLHVRGAPGSHVILRVEGGYSEADVEEAAGIAAAYSKLRNEGYVDVLVTERRNVRKVPGAPPGTATYKNERVLRVRPTSPVPLKHEM
jgi:predicted ribosome quality control (RQC) complex YloA/Tae2 family protein